SGGAPPDDAPNGGGYFYRPTVLGGVRNEMRVAREEIFGPVTVLIGFDDEDEAIALANDTPYGLAAAVWTRDVKRAHRVAHAVQAGTVWINNYRVWNWLMPFGGYKAWRSCSNIRRPSRCGSICRRTPPIGSVTRDGRRAAAGRDRRRGQHGRADG